jgi:hypothetical protein
LLRIYRAKVENLSKILRGCFQEVNYDNFALILPKNLKDVSKTQTNHFLHFHVYSLDYQ